MYGYSEEELDEAFSLVADDDEWRAAIRKTVPGDADLRLIEAAVLYYTGGPAEFTVQPDGTILVTADGYWLNMVS